MSAPQAMPLPGGGYADPPDRFTDFQRDVAEVVRGLQAGELVTYGEVALETGHPGAGQAVANVLRRVPGLPWWRVLPATGRLYRQHREVAEPLLVAEVTSSTSSAEFAWPGPSATRSVDAMRLLRWIVIVAAAVIAMSACSTSGSEVLGEDPGTDGSAPAGATRGDVGGNDALRWGEGQRAVVMAHGAAFDAASWADQATLIADAGFTVVAVEDISPEAIGGTVDALRDEGIEDVTLIGGSAGADGILQLAADQPDLPSALILLSPNSVVEGLGTEPKLFIASEDETVADVSPELADSSDGSQNKAVLLPGSAHAQNIFDTEQKEPVEQMILDRLAEFAGE